MAVTAGTSTRPTILGNINADGFQGGAYGGYNFQNGQFVYGGEADLGYSGGDETRGGIKAKQGVEGSVRARAGIALDPVLLYGTGGLAVTNSKLSSDTGSNSNTRVGWTVGAGAEAKFTQNIVGRVEYRYSDYGKKDFDLGGLDDVSSKLTTNEISCRCWLQVLRRHIPKEPGRKLPGSFLLLFRQKCRQVRMQFLEALLPALEL